MNNEEQKQYRNGAYVVGPESDVQEDLERAKRGLPSLAAERAAEAAEQAPPQLRAVSGGVVPKTHYFSRPDGAAYDLGMARRQFEIWGYVVAHRIAAKDFNYVPPPMQGYSIGKGRRGSMSDIGDMLLIHAQVEAYLLSLPAALRSLAVHAYVKQFRQTAMVKYLFMDDSESEWHHEDDPEPLVPWKDVKRKESCYWEGGWRGLIAPEIDAYSKAMGYSRNSLLEQEAVRILKLYAGKFGIFEEKTSEGLQAA